MFRYETHMHTAEASLCSNSPAADMADKYKEMGYTGIIVTDHFYNGNTSIDRSLPWREWIELYCKGYENAKKRGDEIGLDVFFGFEYGDGASDFLIYGLDKEWLLEQDGIMKKSMTEFLKYARSEGGYIIQAHPFREADYISGTLHAYKLVDGVEICNTSHRDPKFNERAKIYAEWYDLPVTCGSDSHNTTDRFHVGGVMSEKRFTSAVDYVKAVISGDVTLITSERML